MKRKSTIRKMQGTPITRQLYHLAADINRCARQLDKLAAQVAHLEIDSNALVNTMPKANRNRPDKPD